MGEGSTELPLPFATTHLTQEVWAFAHPSDQTRWFWFALFTYLRRVNERFDCWSDSLFLRGFFRWRWFGLDLGNRLLCNPGHSTCLAAFSGVSSSQFCSLLYF
jgi:hypothetical protein